MSFIGKIVSGIQKVVGGTKGRKDKHAEEAKKEFFESKMEEATDEKVDEMISSQDSKSYLNLLLINHNKHQGLETDVSPNLMSPIKQSRRWKFAGSYCVNQTQLLELQTFFQMNQGLTLKDSMSGLKQFRETFADYEVDNPNMEKEV